MGVPAADVIAHNEERLAGGNVVRLYNRVRQHKGHANATRPVGRHHAEATYGMVKNNEPYLETGLKTSVSAES